MKNRAIHVILSAAKNLRLTIVQRRLWRFFAALRVAGERAFFMVNML
jgi:hypothetical protein